MSRSVISISTQNVEQLLPFAGTAEAMLCAKFKFAPGRSRKLVERVLLHFFHRKDANFKNPRRALLHTCHGWAAKGGGRD